MTKQATSANVSRRKFLITGAAAGGVERKSRERKLSGKNTSNKQMQITTAGTIVSTRFKRSKRRCMKYATISAALMIDAPIRITSM